MLLLMIKDLKFKGSYLETSITLRSERSSSSTRARHRRGAKGQPRVSLTADCKQDEITR